MGQIISEEIARLEGLLDGEPHDAVATALEHLGAPGSPGRLLTKRAFQTEPWRA